MLQAGGLAAGAKLELTARGRAALKKDPDEVLLGLWDRWVRDGAIDELSRLEAIKGQKRTNTLSGLKNRRRNAADVLAVLGTHDFTMIEPAFNALFPFGSGFTSVCGERAAYKLYIAEPEYGSLGYAHMEFARTVDMRYLMVLLF